MMLKLRMIRVRKKTLEAQKKVGETKGCMTKTIWSTKEQDKDIEYEQVKSKDNNQVDFTTIVQSKKDFELKTLRGCCDSYIT